MQNKIDHQFFLCDDGNVSKWIKNEIDFRLCGLWVAQAESEKVAGAQAELAAQAAQADQTN